MFENIISFFKKMGRKDALEEKSKETAKERLQLVLMQDRANVSADFLDMMRQEIIEVIKKYIDVDESQIDVKLTNKTNEDGTTGAPALYANIPIAGIKEHLVKKEESNVVENKAENEEKVEIIEETKEEPKSLKEDVEKETTKDKSQEENKEETAKNKVETSNKKTTKNSKTKSKKAATKTKSAETVKQEKTKTSNNKQEKSEEKPKQD